MEESDPLSMKVILRYQRGARLFTLNVEYDIILSICMQNYFEKGQKMLVEIYKMCYNRPRRK